MKNLIHRLDGKLNLVVILMFFWAMFWLLNGGDKFFNGESGINRDVTTGYLLDVNKVDEHGHNSLAYTMHKGETIGYFGVNRDSKMVAYFKCLNLPGQLALASLYGFAIAELLLGVLFLALAFWSVSSEAFREKQRDGLLGLFVDRTLHRIAFKGSVLIFFVFCTGDILFGDRMELWEHGTFIVLTLLTYDMWYRTDRFMARAVAIQEESGEVEKSAQALTY